MLRNILERRLFKMTMVRVLRVAGIAVILSGLILQIPSNASAVQIGLTFSHSGNKYIFSDNPESIPSSDRYTIEETLSSSYTYDIELYHHNLTGSTKRIGVAIYNPNASSATITVYAKKTGYSNTDQSSEVDLTAPLQRDYQMGIGATTLSLSGYSYAFLVYVDTPTGKLVNEKVKIKSSLSNVKMRIFHGPTSVTAQQVFSYSRDSASGSSTTTGFFQNDGLSNSTSIDASSYPSFVLSEWRPSLNQNEYETGTNVLGSSQLGGNYGMVYTITINNPGGKRIKITPNWSASGNNYARIVLWTAANGWYTTTKITPYSYWIMATGTGATFTFKYVLPGGNFGNFKFEVID